MAASPEDLEGFKAICREAGREGVRDAFEEMGITAEHMAWIKQQKETHDKNKDRIEKWRSTFIGALLAAAALSVYNAFLKIFSNGG